VWEGGLLEQHAWTPHKPPHHSLAPCRPLASSASSWAASPSAASHGLWAASPSAREWGFKNRARGSHWHNGRPFLKVPSNQEAGTNATFGRHVSNHYIFGILSSRSVDWYMYGYNPRRGGGARGGTFFWGWSPKKDFGHFYGLSNISSDSWAQAQSIHTLFEQIGSRGGYVDMSKGQRHALWCRPRGESSQRSSDNPFLLPPAQTH